MSMIKHAAIYLGSSIVGKAIPFALLPILTAYLTPEEFGVWSVYQVLMAFMVPLVGLNLQNNITRNFFSVSKERLASIMSNIIIIVIFNTLTLLIILFLMRVHIEKWLDIKSSWLMLLPIIALFTMFKQLYLTLLRNQKEPFRYGAFEIAFTIIMFVIATSLIIGAGFKWQGMVIAATASAIMFGTIGFFFLYTSGYIAKGLNGKTIRQLVIISLPFFPHGVGGIVINMSDRLFIDQMVGKEAVGVYSVGFMFGMIVSIVMGAFNKAWSPWVHEQLANIGDDEKKRLVRVTYLILLLIPLLPIFVWILSLVLMPIMIDARYFEAGQYIVWIAFGYAVQSLYFLVFPYLVHTGKTIYLAKVTFLAALVNLIGNYFLIKCNGTIGAAQATVIAYSIMSIGIWYHASRVYKMPWFGQR
jgi:O-antigen/teichoic acid export membrane protein